MKRYIIPFVLVSILTACPSPVLRWIETPVDHSGLGRLTGQWGGKEIVSLSFGIDGEKDLPIGTNVDISGKIPILVILPEGTGLTGLIPLVTYIGKSVNPPSGKTGNFSSPVTYTVTAEDGSTRDYIVRVYEKGPSTKEIIRLTLDIPGNSALGAEGIINQDTGAGEGAITVTVPAGTPLGLTAHVTHTGAGITGPGLGGTGEPPDFTFHGDFSSPTTWQVFAQDHSTKTYTLRVVWEKDSTKEITAFSLSSSLGATTISIPGETDIIGGEPRSDGVYPIVVLIPDDTPDIDLKNAVPFISYKGAAISPDTKTLDFTAPVPVRYTVSAKDGTTRDYEVQIIRRHLDDEKLITRFRFENPQAEGVIDQTSSPPTITLTVPAGTNLGALQPKIDFKGESLSPASGQPQSFVKATPPVDPSNSPYVSYTVRAGDKSTVSYRVYVFIDDSIPPKVDVPTGGTVNTGVNTDGTPIIFVEFPTYIYNPTINISYPGAGSTTVTKVIDSGNTYNYYNSSDLNINVGMIVIMPPAESAPPADTGKASIDAFYFTNPAAIGTWETDGTTGSGTESSPYVITVKVPYKKDLDLRNLTATICYTGETVNENQQPNPFNDNGNDSSGQGFTSPVNYTVTAADGSTKTYYEVSVEVVDTRKDITAISLLNGSFQQVDTDVIISAYPNAAGKYPIDVTVSASSNTVIGSLTPVITHNGKWIEGTEITSQVSTPTVTPSATNFNWSGGAPALVEYTVTDRDGAVPDNTKTYTVTVHTPVTDDDPQILGFYFNNPLAVGVVNENTHAITVTVPPGTNTGALAPTLYFRGVSVQPGSGVVNNFAGPATYTVTGSTGKTKSYLVTVSPTPSSTKDITGFRLPSVPDAETIIGAVPDPDGTYPLAVYVPAGTPQGSLAPAISHTGVRVTPPAGTALNFNTPQIYTVIAENGSAKTYKVTVNAQDTGAILTSFVFNEVPLGSTPTGYVRAVGSIDQDARTVTVMVPYTAVVTNLIPTLTYIGKSVKEGALGTEQTANPFIGTLQYDFGPGQTPTYTIMGQSSGQAEYTVTVIKQSAATVTFDGEKEIGFATFNQGIGVITVTVDTGEIDGPYEWYVNGVKQAATGANFTLSVGNGFTPGRHEIMVSGWSDGFHYTGKAYFTVSY